MIKAKTKTILIIDDDDLVRESIADFLIDSGFITFQAIDGAAGLQQFVKAKPDLVVCDLKMPKLGGLAVLAEIKKINADLPFIIISGVGGLHDAVAALRLGAWDYMIKPLVDFAALLHSISKAFEHQHLREENKRYQKTLEISHDKLSENLAHLEEDQLAGRLAQQKLLPQNNLKIGKFTLQYYTQASLYLSGDFVDYFAIDDHKFAFYLADVAGHGCASAFVTVVVRHLVHAALQAYHDNGEEIIFRPSMMVEKINDEIKSAAVGKHLTMIYAVLDQKEKTLSYTIAGHTPAPVIYTNGGYQFIKGKGFPLGLMDDIKNDEFTLPIGDDFNFWLLSDGVLECLEQGAFATKAEALLNMLNACNNVAEACGKLQLSSAQTLADDVTLLHIKRSKHEKL